MAWKVVLALAVFYTIFIVIVVSTSHVELPNARLLSPALVLFALAMGLYAPQKEEAP